MPKEVAGKMQASGSRSWQVTEIRHWGAVESGARILHWRGDESNPTMMSFHPWERPSVCSSGFFVAEVLTVVYGFACSGTLDLVPTELRPSRPHKVSAEYALSPSIWYQAQSQGWPCASFSPLFISLFLDFTTIRALLCPTKRLWALASDTSGFKLQLFHLLVGRQNWSEEKYIKVGRELTTWGKWPCLGQGAQTRAGPSPQGLYPAPHSLVTCWALVPHLSQNAQNPWSPPSPSKPGRLRWHHQLLWALDPPLSPDSDQPYNWSSILQPVLAQPYSNAPKYYCSTSRAQSHADKASYLGHLWAWLDSQAMSHESIIHRLHSSSSWTEAASESLMSYASGQVLSLRRGAGMAVIDNWHLPKCVPRPLSIFLYYFSAFLSSLFLSVSL